MIKAVAALLCLAVIGLAWLIVREVGRYADDVMWRD